MIKNPFQTIKATKLDLKLGIFGGYKVGKTVLALSAANDEFGKVAMVDPEGGAKAYIGIYDFDILPSKSYMELINALNFLQSENHEYKTLIIDPTTMVWEAVQEARAKLKKTFGTEGKFADFHGLDWVDMKSTYKSIMARIVNLPMNVIMVFREKDEVVYKGGQGSKTGQVILDGEKNTPYFLDVYGRLTKAANGDRTFEIRGTRYRVLEGKKIKLPKFDMDVDNHGFKKIYDLCGLSKRNQMATGTVKYDVSADKDLEAMNTGQDKRDLVQKPPAKNKAQISEIQKQVVALYRDSTERKEMFKKWKKETDFEGDGTDMKLSDHQDFYGYCNEKHSDATDDSMASEGDPTDPNFKESSAGNHAFGTANTVPITDIPSADETDEEETGRLINEEITNIKESE